VVTSEAGADDGALYDVWARFTVEQVRAFFDRLDALYRARARLNGNPAPAALIDEARALLAAPFDLYQIAWLAEMGA
jgi:hypothetical protein